jgi:hypothetical protein
MATWEMTCTCGEKVRGDGETKEEAVDAVLASWTPEMVQAHIAEKHPNEPPSSPEASRARFLENATLV